REPTWLVVRHAGREGRVEAVEVDRDVERTVEVRAHSRGPGAHVDHLDAEALDLGALAGAHRPDADLHESGDQPLLEDARERTSVRIAIVFEDVVEIGMRVDL